MMFEEEILVVGCGNILFQDDGFGPRVAQDLNNYELPPGIRVIDAGTGAPHLIFTLLDETCKKLIILDCIHWGAKPGTLRKFSVDELPKGKFIDAHNWTLSEPLHDLKDKVEIVVIGCQPAKVSDPDIEIGLTEEVEKAIPKAIEMVFEEIGIEHGTIRQDTRENVWSTI
ncbi:coenzyme F420-reducing hydrogenase, FrhD protein [Methanocella sp. CWC-04]|uniref:Coenzyme F420-reducing hydrogenase, FrhD protein n=1 Tax=Methanooceanicella nereidis TaxID=2052831 RepID=A0AAP2RCL5_9EURY|nr:coenzyme F420-reducing hydrogenase, FrhD protein [Methanocella sp. CWC-04]MCD1293792.1 coenzyme F420-reducing hydrogenase, FrhD protein [Methanocella sp. CWC-04]